ncbi:MAG: Lrp/AsnC family leucine-responsive transcriptional regulator [Candidatus Azotimanducaceae bacterium]|jgi:Lrp/AsnC family leucine-responsive transcriptional regulator
MSGLDWQILQALQDNARVTVLDLSAQLNRSRSSITEHIRRPQDIGVIDGFSIRIEEEKLGVGTSAFVRLQADSSQHRLIVDTVNQIPEVAECHVLTGSDLLMMRVVARDMPHLRDLVDRFTEWGATSTDVIFSSVKKQLEINPRLLRVLST